MEEKAHKLVIFIDELDRCRPDFAVKILERVKHYFDCENVIFVFSINSRELVHTLKVFYGNNFDACRYLERFIDFSVTIPMVKIEKYSEIVGFDSIPTVTRDVVFHMAKKYNMSLREIEKYFRAINVATGKYFDDSLRVRSKLHSFYFCYILPIMIGLKFISHDMYISFVEGNDFDILKNVLICMNEIENACEIAGISLSRNEENDLNNIKEKYNQIFNKDNSTFSYVEIASLISDFNSQSYQNELC